jgi:phosphoenolpyruvate synthase/pyruvate phosphate dikinase
MKSKDQQLLEEAYTKINESAKLSDNTILARYSRFAKQLDNQEITRQQWTDLCLNLLGDIVNAISKEAMAKKAADAEHKDYEAYWNKREEGGTGF